MLRLIFLLLAIGCSHSNPQLSDTNFKEKDRDWIQVYIHEVNTAIEHEDHDAYHFFMRELIKEIKLLNKKGRGG